MLHEPKPIRRMGAPARRSMDGMDPRLIALVNLQEWLETYLTLEIDDFPRFELANPLSYQR